MATMTRLNQMQTRIQELHPCLQHRKALSTWVIFFCLPQTDGKWIWSGVPENWTSTHIGYWQREQWVSLHNTSSYLLLYQLPPKGPGITKKDQVPEPCRPHVKSRHSSGLLASACVSPSNWGCLSSKSRGGSSLSHIHSLSLCHAACK